MSSFLFVDSRVEDVEVLLAGVDEDAQLVVLDAGSDGIKQMLLALRAAADVEAIHIVSHGASGTLILGSTVLTDENLDDYQTDLAQIGASLGDNGDLLLYGCDVGAGASGKSFIDALARYTGADVAVSTDDTGSASLGGNWVLEASTGPIEAAVPFDAQALDAYAHLLIPAGSLDTTFSGDGKVITAITIGQTDVAAGLVLQPDGRIVVAGYTWNGADYDFALARYNASGSLDTTFSGDGKLTTAIGSSWDLANGLALQSDGKIVAAGYSYNGANDDFAVVRYNANGTPDTTFDGDGIATTPIGTVADNAYSVAIQSDGKIVVAGRAWNGSNYDFAVARYNTNGSLDTSFDGDGKVTTPIGAGDEWVNGVAIQADGRIVAGGYSFNGSNFDFAVVRYNTNGTLDTSFDGDGKATTAIGTGDDSGYALLLQSDGKMVVGGRSFGANDNFALVRYNTNGTLDATFDGDGKVTTAIGSGDDRVFNLVQQSDGKIVAVGRSHNGVNFDFALVRYNTNGTLDTTFDGDGKVTIAVGSGDDYAYDVAVQSDGKIIAAGDASGDFGLIRVLGSELLPALAISPLSANQAEGNSGATSFTFTVTRAGDLTGTTTVDWTAGISGITPSADAADFGGTFPSGALSFAPTETSKTVTVNVVGDTLYESGGLAENFAVTLSNASGGAIINVVSATGNIQNDDALPALSIAATNADAAEGDSGMTEFTFTVRRTDNVSGTTTVDWTVVASGTSPSADAADFGGAFPGGTLTFAPTQTAKTLAVGVSGDALYESGGLPENFIVTLSNASDGAIITTASASGSIQNDDSASSPTVSIAAASADKAEGNVGTTPFTFTVNRAGDLAAALTVDWVVTPSNTAPSADAADFGGAFPGGIVSFASGEATKTITVDVIGDALFESGGVAEDFVVTLSNASGGATISIASAAGRIQNDDAGGGGTTLVGGNGDDTLNGGNGDDSLIGEPGNDTLDGGEGNDTLSGGPGDDTLTGAGGSDTADYSDAPGAVIVNLAAGTATGAAGVDILSSIENAIGSAFADTLIGNSGPNVLDGRGGADTMQGGLGNDTYYVDVLGDRVIEGPNSAAGLSFATSLSGAEPVPLANALEGFIDTVIAAISFSLANVAEVENLLLAAASAAAAGTGNELDNELTGNELNNVLTGLGGNDTLRGGEGNDTLDGGDGTDTLLGGAGDDALYGGAGTDLAEFSGAYATYDISTLHGGKNGAVSGYQVSSAGEGADFVGADVESLKFHDRQVTPLGGTTGNDLLNGTDGDDWTEGLAGNDVLYGGRGDDILDGAAGNDYLRGDSALVSSKGGGTSISEVGSGADVLTGGDGADTLLGGPGDDTLNGGSGLDVAIYSGVRSSYVLTKTASGIAIQQSSGGDGSDTLLDVERVQFSNWSVAFDLEGNAGRTAKLLGAVFGVASVADRTYAGIGLDLLDGGMSYEALMAAAINVAGAATPAQVVALLWTNLVGSAPSAEQAQPIVDILNGGMAVGALGVVAAETTLNQVNIGFAGLVEAGLEYI